MIRTLYLSGWRTAAPLPAGGLVVTPNRRAAGAIAHPPLSLEGLARRRLRAIGLLPVSAIQAHRLLVDLARTELGAADPAGVASAYAPVIKALYRAGADLAAMVAHAPARSARVARLALAYRQALRAQGWYDGAEGLRLAAADPGPQEPFHVRGYPRLGADEQAYLLAACAPGSTIHLPDEPGAVDQDAQALVEACRAAGWAIADLDGRRDTDGHPLVQVVIRAAADPEAPPRPFPHARAHEHADMEAEVRATLAAVKALLAAGVAPGAIAVVARDDAAYGPLAIDVAWEYGVPLRALYAVPLRQTRVGAWLDLLLEAAGAGFPFEPTYRLLNHPLSPVLPDAQRQAARRGHPAGAAGWEAVDAAHAAFSWPAQEPNAGWIARLRSLLREPELKRRAARWPRELRALRKLDEALEPLLAPLDGRTSLRDLRQALALALDLLTVPAQPGRGGVELHTPLSIYGARYEHVFVLGMVEGVLPAPVADSPVVDFHERKQLAALGIHLEEAPAAARRERRSFLAMAHTAAVGLTMSCPRLYAGKPVVPSAYFAELGLTPGSPPPAPIASLEEARRIWLAHPQLPGAAADPAMPAIRSALAVEDRREGEEPADGHDGLIGRGFDLDALWMSATKLVTIGQCPYRWYAQYGLGLGAPDEPEDVLSPSLRGTLYHKALELALADPGDDPVQAALDRLEASFAQAEREVEVPAIPGWHHARAEHMKTLRRAIRGEGFVREGAAVVAREAWFEGTWYGLRVRGSVDRIDRGPTGLQFVDYKSRASKPPGAQDANGDATLDVQLPLYVAAAAPVLYPGEAVADARYYSLTAAKEIKTKPPAEGELEGLADRIKGNLRTGSFPVTPDVAGNACEYCEVAAVCRRGPRLERKLGAARVKLAARSQAVEDRP